MDRTAGELSDSPTSHTMDRSGGDTSPPPSEADEDGISHFQPSAESGGVSPDDLQPLDSQATAPSAAAYVSEAGADDGAGNRESAEIDEFAAACDVAVDEKGAGMYEQSSFVSTAAGGDAPDEDVVSGEGEMRDGKVGFGGIGDAMEEEGTNMAHAGNGGAVYKGHVHGYEFVHDNAVVDNVVIKEEAPVVDVSAMKEDVQAEEASDMAAAVGNREEATKMEKEVGGVDALDEEGICMDQAMTIAIHAVKEEGPQVDEASDVAAASTGRKETTMMDKELGSDDAMTELDEYMDQASAIIHGDLKDEGFQDNSNMEKEVRNVVNDNSLGAGDKEGRQMDEAPRKSYDAVEDEVAQIGEHYCPAINDATEVEAPNMDEEASGSDHDDVANEDGLQIDEETITGGAIEENAIKVDEDHDMAFADGDDDTPKEADEQMDDEEDDPPPIVRRRGGWRRKRGRPLKGQTPRATVRRKDDEEVCFICFDGGELVVCDRRGCPKVYHPSCVNRDEAFFRAKGRWNCGWHICSGCQKPARFMCYMCTHSLCKGCIKGAHFVCVRGNMGFCQACLNTVTLIERHEQGIETMDGVDFNDKNCWEYLFRDYWSDLKRKHSLSVEEVSEAKAGQNTSPSVAHDKGPLDDGLPDTNGDEGASSDSSDDQHVESTSRRKRVNKRLKHTTSEEGSVKSARSFSKQRSSGRRDARNSSRKRLKKLSLHTSATECSAQEENVGSSTSEGINWASKELLEFVAQMRGGDKSVISQFDVQALLLEYIKQKNLRDPRRKSQIVCDVLLQNLFGKPRVGHFEMLKLLESHFLMNEVSPVDTDENQGGVVDPEPSPMDAEGNNESSTVMSSDKRRKTRRKSAGKEPQTNLDDYAAINVHNINLMYLRRNLMEDMVDDIDIFDEKVVGSFVKIRISGAVQRQDIYRLVQVVGTGRTAEKYKTGKKTTDITLEILNLDKKETITIDIISNQEFTEEECKRLRQSIKCGFIPRLAVGEVQEKARVLQAVKVNDWIETEKQRLGHLRDRASDLGRRKELRECVEKLQLLNTPEERVRRLNDVPEIHSDPTMDPDYESSEEAEPVVERKDHYGGGRDSFFRKGNEAVTFGKGNYRKESQRSAKPNRESNHSASTEVTSHRESPNRFGDKENHSSSSGNTIYQTNNLGIANTVTKATISGVILDNNQHGKSPGVISDTQAATYATGFAAPSDGSESEKMWHYADPSGKVQGPFSMAQLRKWNTTGYFPPNLRIWRSSENQDESIQLTNALIGRFEKDMVGLEPRNSSSQSDKIASRGNLEVGVRGCTSSLPDESSKKSANIDESRTRIHLTATANDLVKTGKWDKREPVFSAPANEVGRPAISSRGGESSMQMNSWQMQNQSQNGPRPVAPLAGVPPYQSPAGLVGGGQTGNNGAWTGGQIPGAQPIIAQSTYSNQQAPAANWMAEPGYAFPNQLGINLTQLSALSQALGRDFAAAQNIFVNQPVISDVGNLGPTPVPPSVNPTANTSSSIGNLQASLQVKKPLESESLLQLEKQTAPELAVKDDRLTTSTGGTITADGHGTKIDSVADIASGNPVISTSIPPEQYALDRSSKFSNEGIANSNSNLVLDLAVSEASQLGIQHHGESGFKIKSGDSTQKDAHVEHVLEQGNTRNPESNLSVYQPASPRNVKAPLDARIIEQPLSALESNQNNHLVQSTGSNIIPSQSTLATATDPMHPSNPSFGAVGSGQNQAWSMVPQNANAVAGQAQGNGNMNWGTTIQGNTNMSWGMLGQVNTNMAWGTPAQGNPNFNMGIGMPPQATAILNTSWVAPNQGNAGMNLAWAATQGQGNANPAAILGAQLPGIAGAAWGALQQGNTNPYPGWMAPQVVPNAGQNVNWATPTQGNVAPNLGSGSGQGNANMNWNPNGNSAGWGTQQSENGGNRPGKGGNGMWSGGEGRSSRPAGEQRGGVCRFYENGHCRKGAYCNYYHPPGPPPRHSRNSKT